MERMDMHSRKQYLKVLIKRYLKINKKEKGLLLDEYCKNTGQNRKYVIRKIRQLAFKEPQPRKRRRTKYGYVMSGIFFLRYGRYLIIPVGKG